MSRPALERTRTPTHYRWVRSQTTARVRDPVVALVLVLAGSLTILPWPVGHRQAISREHVECLALWTGVAGRGAAGSARTESVGDRSDLRFRDAAASDAN